MKAVLVAYLESPATRRESTERALARQPEEALKAILSFDGPYPEDSSPVDVFPDFLSPLLSGLLMRAPELLLTRDRSRLSSGKRWSLLAAAIATRDPRFADVVVSSLRDRVADVRTLAVEAIADEACFRQARARPLLERLLTLKSMSYARGRVQRALRALPRVL